MGNELQLTITYYPLPKAQNFVPHPYGKCYNRFRNLWEQVSFVNSQIKTLFGNGPGGMVLMTIVPFGILSLTCNRFLGKPFTRESWLGLTNSQFPIPNSQFPIPNSQFPKSIYFLVLFKVDVQPPNIDRYPL
jgi:hypothetical protein